MEQKLLMYTYIHAVYRALDNTGSPRGVVFRFAKDDIREFVYVCVCVP